MQFLGGRDDGQGGGGGGFTPRSDVPVDDRDFQPAGAPAGNGSSARRGRRHPVLSGGRSRPSGASVAGAPDALRADLLHC